MHIETLKEIGREHLKRHLPKSHRELEKSGQLDEHLQRAAKQTKAEMRSLVSRGYSQDEAWQMTRERYLILPAEKPRSRSRGTRRTRGIFQTLTAMQELRLEVEQEAEVQRGLAKGPSTR